MKKFKRVEPPILDSSAAQTFKRCPRHYFYRYVLGFRPKEEPPYFRFGSAYHRFREVLQKTDSLKEALVAANHIFRSKGGDPPVGTQWEYLTELRLFKSCALAFERREKEKKIGAITVVASEQIFNVELRDGSRRGGRADEMVRWNGQLWGRDFKTSSKMGKFYERTLEPNDQFSCYTFAETKLAGEPVRGQIVELLYNTKTQGPEIHQFLATRTETQLANWEDQQIFWGMFLNTCRMNDVWPQNENACYNCPFHSVCKSATEGTMMNRLEQDYVFEPWDFSKVSESEDAVV